MTPLRSLGNPDISPFDDVFAATGKRYNHYYDPTTPLTSVHFDGTNDYLDGTEATYTDLNFPGDFTIEGGIRYDGGNIAATNDTIIDTRIGENSGRSDDGWTWWVRTNGKVALYDGNNSSYVLESETTLSTDTWYHVALVRASNNYRLYLNGTLDDGPNSDSNTLYMGSQFNVGYKADYPPSSLTYWDGILSNIRIVKGTAVYTENFSTPTAPLESISGTVFLGLNSSTVTATTTAPSGLTLTNNGCTTSSESPF